MSRLLAAIAGLALVELVINVVFRPQSGPPALAAVFEPHLLAVGAVCGALAILLTLGERSPGANRIRVLGVVVIVVALVRVGGEWWSPERAAAADGPGPGEQRITLLTWNLEAGSRAVSGTVEALLDPAPDDAPDDAPDIVALQELTPDMAAALDASEAIDRRYPYRILEARDDARGMGVLSRLPLERGAYGAFPMLLTAGVLLDDGSRLDLVNAHPFPPRVATIAGIPWGIETRRRDKELEAVAAAVGRAGDSARVLVIGDLNTTPFERGFGIVADGMTDAHAAVGTGTGFTWRPSWLEGLRLGLLRIDHVLGGADVTPVSSSEDCSLPGDHCRVTVVVDVAARPR